MHDKARARERSWTTIICGLCVRVIHYMYLDNGDMNHVQVKFQHKYDPVNRMLIEGADFDFF